MEPSTSTKQTEEQTRHKHKILHTALLTLLIFSVFVVGLAAGHLITNKTPATNTKVIQNNNSVSPSPTPTVIATTTITNSNNDYTGWKTYTSAELQMSFKYNDKFGNFKYEPEDKILSISNKTEDKISIAIFNTEGVDTRDKNFIANPNYVTLGEMYYEPKNITVEGREYYLRHLAYGDGTSGANPICTHENFGFQFYYTEIFKDKVEGIGTTKDRVIQINFQILSPTAPCGNTIPEGIKVHEQEVKDAIKIVESLRFL